jgi:hypothetical protein
MSKLDQISNKYLLIEFIDTRNYGPYRDKPPLEKEVFLNSVSRYFPNTNMFGLSTDYKTNRVNREIYLFSK